MDTSDIATLTLGLAILGFLWTLHKDIASLRERMARLEQQFSFWLFRCVKRSPRSEGVPPSMEFPGSFRGQDAPAK